MKSICVMAMGSELATAVCEAMTKKRVHATAEAAAEKEKVVILTHWTMDSKDFCWLATLCLAEWFMAALVSMCTKAKDRKMVS